MLPPTSLTAHYAGLGEPHSQSNLFKESGGVVAGSSPVPQLQRSLLEHGAAEGRAGEPRTVLLPLGYRSMYFTLWKDQRCF